MIDPPDLIAAGVDSVKIEGRAKSAYYAAIVTGAYRHCSDDVLAGRPLDPVWRAEVEKVSHRHYSTGFFHGQPGQFTQDARYIRDWQVVAEVVSCDQTGLATASLRNKFAQGDAIELVGPDVRPVAYGPHDGGRDSAPWEPRHPQMKFQIQLPCYAPAPLVPAGLPGELVIGPNELKTHPGRSAARLAGGGFFPRRRSGNSGIYPVLLCRPRPTRSLRWEKRSTAGLVTRMFTLLASLGRGRKPVWRWNPSLHPL